MTTKHGENLYQAHSDLGVSLLGARRFVEAKRCFERAIALAPWSFDALANYGISQSEAGDLASALKALRRAVSLKTYSGAAYFNYGNALLREGRGEEAVSAFGSALVLEPFFISAMHGRAIARQSVQYHYEAIHDFTRVVFYQNNFADALSGRAMSILEVGSPHEALREIEKATLIDPSNAEIRNNHGVVLARLRRHFDAIKNYEAAIVLRVDYQQAWTNRGGALRVASSFEESFVSADRALRIDPKSPDNWKNRGFARIELGEHAAALSDYCEAINIQPDHVDSRWERAVLLLTLGDYASGWDEYEWRWRLPTRKPLVGSSSLQSRWTGRESIVGKVLLLQAEQGIGDTLQFIRYASLLADRGAIVIAEVPGSLLRLVRGVTGVREAVETGQALPVHDFYCPMMSLPLAFVTSLQTIPFGNRPYIEAQPEDIENWRNKLESMCNSMPVGDRIILSDGKSRRRVGVVWNGGFRPDQPELWEVNSRRNIPLEAFAAALDIPGIDFVSLQKGDPAESELRGRESEFWKKGRIFNVAEDLRDFADTAGAIANLDLVISVDTSTAHLSAAMGKPTWILNRYDTCWRWLLDREDSPWYGSVRLYRQGSDRSWRAVLHKLAEDLRAWHSLSANVESKSG